MALKLYKKILNKIMDCDKLVLEKIIYRKEKVYGTK